jgi:hypothetical protein
MKIFFAKILIICFSIASFNNLNAQQAGLHMHQQHKAEEYLVAILISMGMATLKRSCLVKH